MEMQVGAYSARASRAKPKICAPRMVSPTTFHAAINDAWHMSKEKSFLGPAYVRVA